MSKDPTISEQFENAAKEITKLMDKLPISYARRAESLLLDACSELRFRAQELRGHAPPPAEEVFIEERNERGGCKKCGSKLNPLGYCTDETCPYADRKQYEAYSEE